MKIGAYERQVKVVQGARVDRVVHRVSRRQYWLVVLVNSQEAVNCYVNGACAKEHLRVMRAEG